MLLLDRALITVESKHWVKSTSVIEKSSYRTFEPKKPSVYFMMYNFNSRKGKQNFFLFYFFQVKRGAIKEEKEMYFGKPVLSNERVVLDVGQVSSRITHMGFIY